VLVSELLVERQIEARCTFADEGRDVTEIGIVHELLLEALGFALNLLERGTFGQPQVDQDFGAVRGGGELLGDEGEADDAGGECGDGQNHDGPALAYAPTNHGADRTIRATIENVVVVRAAVMNPEQLIADPRREIDCREPGNYQGNARDPEQCAHILAGG